MKEPVAYMYETARFHSSKKGYFGWNKQVTLYKPNVPEGSIRNLTPLYKKEDSNDEQL